MIRKMSIEDWDTVSEIYKQGIETGTATFNTECPDYNSWDESHIKDCRFVYCEDNKVIGWIALSPTSSREAYKGVAEISIYVEKDHFSRGAGTSLINEVIKNAPKYGIWSLFSVVLTVNKSSLDLHKKCGFREIGYKERVAKDKFGKWQNTTLFEYRL